MAFHAKRLFHGGGALQKSFTALVSVITATAGLTAFAAHPAGAAVIGSDVDASVTAPATSALGSDVAFAATLSSDGTLASGSATLTFGVTGGTIDTAPSGCTTNGAKTSTSCPASSYPTTFNIAVAPSGVGRVVGSVTESAGDVNVVGDDDECPGSTVCSATTNVGQATSTTTLTSSQNPSAFGQAVTFTATVTGFGTPTGTVTFNDGASSIGSGTLSGGVATLSTSALSGGTHSITATYGGDSNNAGSTSPTLTQIVGTASTTTSLTDTLANPVSGQPANQPSVGQAVTYTATVSPAPDGGTVNFTDGGASIGCDAVAVTNGTATCQQTYTAIGSHSISAAYSGDNNFGSSSGGPLSITVFQAFVAPGGSTTQSGSFSQTTFTVTNNTTNGTSFDAIEFTNQTKTCGGSPCSPNLVNTVFPTDATGAPYQISVTFTKSTCNGLGNSCVAPLYYQTSEQFNSGATTATPVPNCTSPVTAVPCLVSDKHTAGGGGSTTYNVLASHDIPWIQL